MLLRLREVVNKLLSNENHSSEKKHRLELIKKILEDDYCFFKLDINISINIIEDLGFSRDDALNIYKELISSKNFN